MVIHRFDRRIKHLQAMPLDYDDNLIQKGGTKVYKNVTVIAPGEWSDMITNAPVLWTAEKLEEFADSWQSNYVNLGHSHYPLDFVGTVQNQRWDGKAIKGDIYIDPMLSRGKDTITGIDNKHLNHVSVEVMTEDTWDSRRYVRLADNISWIGLSILGPWPGPACAESVINSD